MPNSLVDGTFIPSRSYSGTIISVRPEGEITSHLFLSLLSSTDIHFSSSTKTGAVFTSSVPVRINSLYKSGTIIPRTGRSFQRRSNKVEK